MKEKYFESNNLIKMDTSLSYFSKGVTRINNFYSSAEKNGGTEFNVLKENAQN